MSKRSAGSAWGTWVPPWRSACLETSAGPAEPAGHCIKAEPLIAKGGKVVDKLADLAGMDVVFSIVSTGKDLDEVYFAQGRCGERRRQGL